METEIENNMKIAYTYKEFIMGMCAMFFYIFVNPFTSCVTDRYLPQQYIIMALHISAHGNYRLITHTIAMGLAPEA